MSVYLYLSIRLSIYIIIKYEELKVKYNDSQSENKRLQDRIDSLEFYAKTKSNSSSAFHNLNSSSTSSISNRDRGRSPMPPTISSSSSTIPRTRRPSVSRSSVERQIYPSSSSSVYSPSSTITSSFYDRPSTTRSSVERQLNSYDRTSRSSVERQLPSATSSHYDKPPVAPLPSSISMLKLGNSLSSSSRYGINNNSLPYSSYSSSSSSSPYYTGRYNRYQRDYLLDNDNNTISSSVIMRRREKSADRSLLPSISTSNSSLTRMRRSSFADTTKYY